MEKAIAIGGRSVDYLGRSVDYLGRSADYLGRTIGDSKEDCFESQLTKLKDDERCEAYRSAVFDHLDIKNKVVVDVCCGVGLLSIFCAKAGAKKVYAVEPSELLVNKARDVVKAIGLSGVINVLYGDVKDVSINEPVDIIISDWMGHMLCYKSMLGRVITARDRWLKPGGLVIPSQANLYMAPVQVTNGYRDRITFWTDVFGIDMSVVIPLAKACTCVKPSVEGIEAKDVISQAQVVKHVDCYTISPEELESFESEFKFVLLPQDETVQDFDLNATPPPPATAKFHGFAFWFDVEFANPSSSPGDEAVVLSTAPTNSDTDRKQTLLYVYDPTDVVQDEQVGGTVTIKPLYDNSKVDIVIKYKLGGKLFVKHAEMG